MTTIKDIAELAGVSRGTVDRVLNSRGAVSPQTAEKVLEIARALGYRPNKAGTALAAQKKKYKIGVLLFSEHNPFFDEVMEGVRAKAEELQDYGITTITRRVEFDANAQLSAIDELMVEGIHGLMLAPCNHICIQKISGICCLPNLQRHILIMNGEIRMQSGLKRSSKNKPAAFLQCAHKCIDFFCKAGSIWIRQKREAQVFQSSAFRFPVKFWKQQKASFRNSVFPYLRSFRNRQSEIPVHPALHIESNAFS